MDKKIWPILSVFFLLILALFLRVFSTTSFASLNLMIKDEGVTLPIEQYLDFRGLGVDCVNDFSALSIICTITGTIVLPGGADGEIQYNNGGVFGGISGAYTLDGITLTLVAPILGTPASINLTNATGLVLTTGVTGVLPTTNGGTGLSAAGTAGNLLTSNGTVWVSSAPAAPAAIFWNLVQAPVAPAGFTSPAGFETNLSFLSTTQDAWTMQSTTLTTGNLVTLYAPGAVALQVSSGALNLPSTTDATTGVITKAGLPFIHDFALAGTSGNNLFVGVNAGNFTMTGSTGAQGSNNVGIGPSALVANTTGTSNIAIGRSTLQANTTGNFNTAIGDLVLFSNTVGESNMAFGYGSMALNTSGYQNVAVGSTTLSNNIDGFFNVAIGDGAMTGNASGSNNVAIGKSSLISNDTGVSNVGIGASSLAFNLGSYNTGIGSNSLNNTDTGTYNTALGAYSGYDLTSGSDNILIGAAHFVGAGITTGSNNIIIGQDLQNQVATDSNQLNIGNLIFATGLASGTTISSGNVGIGNTAPSAMLTLGRATGTTGRIDFLGTTSGTVGLTTAAAAGTWVMTLPTTAGTSGYALTTDGAGVTSWTAAGGTPGGSSTQVQYNNAGVFGGITGATTDGTTLTLVAPVLGTPASVTLTNATGLPLTTGVTGVLPTANGGTGLSAAGTSGNILTSNGTIWTSAAPAVQVVRWDQVLAPNTTAGFTSPAGSETTLTFSATTQNAWTMQSSTLTTGRILNIVGTSTARPTGTNSVNAITISGANAAASAVVQGLAISVTNTGTTGTNTALYLSASGATTNNGLVVANGNVGIGTTLPLSSLHVASANILDITLQSQGTTNTSYLSQAGATTAIWAIARRPSDGVFPSVRTAASIYLNSGSNDSSIGFTTIDVNSTTPITRMWIDKIGNVGIGDLTPASLLTVGSGDLFRVTSAGVVSTAATTASTSITTGAIINAGGLGVSGAVFIGGSALNVGVTGGNTGVLKLLGTTSGTISLTTAAAAGTWTLTLPTTDGNANEFLKTDGSGVTSWAPASAVVGATDFRQGLTAPDGAPITIYTATNGTSVLRVTATIFATAFTSGTATYTIAWTQNGTAQTLAVTSLVLNTLGSATATINPDNATTVTGQLTGIFVATETVTGVVEQLK